MKVGQTVTAILVVLMISFGCDGCDSEEDDDTMIAGPNTGGMPENIWTTDRLAPQELAQRYLRGAEDRSRTYYETYREDSQGDTLLPRFPASVPLTPPTIPCGEAVVSDPTWWEHATWRALNFHPTEDLHFSYQYDSVGMGGGARFQITAFGDLDCDGVLSTYFRGGTAISRDNIQGYTDVLVVNPDE